MTSIRIVGLEKRFGEVKALSEVNLSIEKGEFFTLLGPSGCGKTTLLRTIAGFYRQDRGEIWLGEERVDEVPAHRRDTGMVFQNYAVFPHMTVFENVAYGLRVRKLPKAEIERRVEASLRTVHLEGFEARTPDQLSGGQQQRVGLARAMAIEPRVLLFDEPLSNLDAKLRVEMREEIRAVQKALGITAIYVTHDQEEALVISDRIAVVSGGRIQQVGSPWEVYKDPANLFVASFVGKVNLLDGELAGPSASGPGLGAFRSGGLELAVQAPPGAEGRPLRAAFRPEDADENPAPGSPNALRGRVAASSFLGSVASYEVEIGGSRIVVERHGPAALGASGPGTELAFALPPERILLFDPASGSRLRPEGAASPEGRGAGR
ncbi:MAG TPA: ABC transporter ATP-binding protein [Spirochaetia bacterium]|nr:ABC transporter ATP-binding protein [Spirochaetia bacterium]HRZ65086.1 ABC transporter ATP-binding protein [Spirochaetia bacterium]